MPDIGLFELLVIGILLFVVVGPERMPEFFSQIGRWVQTGRAWMSDFRSEISRETADIRTPIQDARASFEQEVDGMGRTVRDMGSVSHAQDAAHAQDAKTADESVSSGNQQDKHKAD